MDNRDLQEHRYVMQDIGVYSCLCVCVCVCLSVCVVSVEGSGCFFMISLCQSVTVLNHYESNNGIVF